MMASTMTIPQIATLPTFHGHMPSHMPGPMPGAMPGAMPRGIPGGFHNHQVPASVQGRMISGPVVNGQHSPTAALSPSLQTFRVPVVPVGGGCYNDGMEVVWHGEFSRLFSSFFPPHVWYLSITNSAPQEKWKFYRDSAKVRFCCQDCGNGWTSMKGRVTFWFHLNSATSEGFVQFKLYGQVCKKCNSGKFEYVMWYPEEVSKVMCNLYNKVGQTFYGFMQPPIRIDRRPGRPRNQHNAELCQACRDGECDQGRPVKSVYNYIPPGVAPRAPSQPIQGRPPMPPNMGPVSQMPVMIRQPPIPHPGHIVMQAPVNPQGAPISGPMVQTSHSGPLFTAPVTLTSGIQPILTYSIVTAPAKEAPKLAPVTEATETEVSDNSKIIELTNGDTTRPPVSKDQIKPKTTTPDTTKPTTVSIKSTIINGVIPTKEDDAPEAIIVKKATVNATEPLSGSPVLKQNDAASKASNIGQMHVVNGSPAKKVEKNPPKVTSIVNGYAAAAGKAPATGKPNGVTAV